jgi:lipoprotein Spr
VRNQANPHLAPLDERQIDRLTASARKLIEHRTRALEARFGWTYLEADIVASAATRQLIVSGTVIFPSLGRQVAEELWTIVPNGWIVVNRLRAAPAGDWYSLRPGITRLESSLGLSQPRSALTTELFQRDGPVQCLAITPRGRLVRALDGTVGWTRHSLGPATRPPSPSPIRADLPRLMQLAKSYLRVPYRFGGTTRSGIDCSGLIQRTLRDAFDVVIPRHSLDQIRAGGSPSRDFGRPGDAIYIWSHGQTSWHVGLTMASEKRGPPTVIHASTSRRRVIEESLERFVAGADRVRHVELDQFFDAVRVSPERET